MTMCAGSQQGGRRCPAGRVVDVETSRPPAGPCEDHLAMLEIRSLRKSFGALVAVDDVSFTVERGQLVGLLGPNGAGKTTTVSMIAGVGRPDGGDVLIDGRRLAGDADPAKRRLGLVPQDLALYEELTARDNLRFFGALYGLTGRALDDAMAQALESSRPCRRSSRRRCPTIRSG